MSRAARTRPRRRQGGFTLVETILVAAAMTLALIAGLGAFDAFGRGTDENRRLTAAQDTARTAIDRLTRDLRNAAPTSATSAAVQRNGDYDLVFMSDRPGYGTASGSSRLVRYCVQATGASTGRLVAQVAAAGVTSLPSSTCPDASWGTTARVADGIVNLALSRPLWAYDNASAASVRTIRIDLWVDDDPAHRPPPVEIQSAVYLRNRALTAPTASSSDFGASCSASGQALLTTGLSIDANGDPLTVSYGDNGVAVGSGASLTHTLTSGTHDLTLTVTNVLGLSTILHRTLSCP
jgi:type II secretory pathway pseudopilin PulG